MRLYSFLSQQPPEVSALLAMYCLFAGFSSNAG